MSMLVYQVVLSITGGVVNNHSALQLLTERVSQKRTEVYSEASAHVQDKNTVSIMPYFFSMKH